ncbi:hypothetical protein [Burkholderia glumae]|uniref:hypothetical protein n=1 Tax=Burkholderia glumae TaxID=337 RepID=UPI0021510264|nr:hypothetical protein [Burkholderia glumae]UVS93464.1 hypothetical protein EFP17_28185 [Burkholderia glumae]
MKNHSTATAEGKSRPAQLRCRPGDLARVVCSRNPALSGRTVIVENFCDEHGRWFVVLLGEPAFGFSINDGRPMISNDAYFRDTSLVPLRGDEQESTERETEACHD